MESWLIFVIAFWALLGGIVIMRAYFSLQVRRSGERLLPDGKAIEREGRGAFAFRVIMFFVMIAIVALYTINSPWMSALSIPLPDWLRWAGFAIGIASLIFWTWTQAALGKEWSPQLQLRKEHHLVTSGPYAWIRHPIYTAMIGIGIAFALVTANWCFVVLSVVVIAGLLSRVPKEERMMVEKFGDEYKIYMKKTGRFFPKLANTSA